MNLISRAEGLILLAILNVGDNAYGVSILEFLQEKTGNVWSFAQIYDPLDKLTWKGEAGSDLLSMAGPATHRFGC
jgi:hypothetical protein